MRDAGLVNVGQLARERHGDEAVVLVGFGSYTGSVIAGDRWGAPMRRMAVPAARDGSIEAFLHAELPDADGGHGRPEAALVVVPQTREHRPEWLTEWRPHRAIGVVYSPRRERYGNYVPTVLGDRYDAFLFLDRTSALRPLHVVAERAEEAETYPFGV
jgi:erythromycin esterase-like protein